MQASPRLLLRRPKNNVPDRELSGGRDKCVVCIACVHCVCVCVYCVCVCVYCMCVLYVRVCFVCVVRGVLGGE